MKISFGKGIAIVITFLVGCQPLAATGPTSDQSGTYMPVIGGVMRTRYEFDLNSKESRLQVRNARINIGGNIAPNFGYYVLFDISDCGTFKFLDAYGRIGISNWLKIQAGRQRIPFSVDASRGPQNYYFSNRSFIGKQVGNVRAVGIKAMTVLPGTSAYFDAGIFQMHGGTQSEWTHQRFTYAAKCGYKFGNVKMEVGVESVLPDSIRLNLLDASVNWSNGRWTVEGEYVNKAYTHNSYKTVHAFNLLTDYTMPIKLSTFNMLSFQGRYDGMTDHSSGVPDASGVLTTTDCGRQRVTVGVTLGYVRAKYNFLLRLNYENYFYQHNFTPSVGEGDKLLAEMVLVF